MLITTFARSVDVLRTLFIKQPEPAWKLVQKQRIHGGMLCFGGVHIESINQSP